MSKKTPATRQAFKDGLAAAMKQISVSSKAIPKGTFKKYGGYAGSYAAGAMGYNPAYGKTAGSYIGGQIAKISGRGDYNLRTTSARNRRLTSAVPQFTNVDRGGSKSVIISHREYIGDITTGSAALVNGATPYQTQSYAINPGLLESFPWFNNVAINYSQYSIKGMMFHYKSNSATALNSTNTALGAVILSTQYDSAQGAYLNKLQQENSEYCQSGRPSEDVMHIVECKSKSNVLSNLYTRSGAIPTGADIRMYDYGIFQISTQGMQAANSVIGELWVTFEIELFRPVLDAGIYNIQSAQYYTQATIGTATPMGSSPWAAVNDNQLPLTFTTTYFEFPDYICQGIYKIQFFWTGTGVTWVPPVPTITNGTALPYIELASTTPGASSQECPFSGALVTTLANLNMLVQVNAVGGLKCRVALGTAGTVPAQSLNIYVTQWNGNMDNLTQVV